MRVIHETKQAGREMVCSGVRQEGSNARSVQTTFSSRMTTDDDQRCCYVVRSLFSMI